ncbi:sensor histidine kinase [Spirillospora sp. CA-128828]|uniref:sensor histidine kinase n=1 Tax=Spirillospora sp. CA-128828 TaxID=3240033 RepID=UPI003D9032A8
MRRPSDGALSGRRLIAGWALALAGPPLLTLLLAPVRSQIGLASTLLLFLTFTVLVAVVGGLGPALLAAVAGNLLTNWFFTPPYYTLTIADFEHVLALVLWVVVAVAVSLVVDLSERRRRWAAQSGAESVTLSRLSTTVLRGEDTLPDLLRQARETFALSSVSLLEGTGHGWSVVGFSGEDHCTDPGKADMLLPVTDELLLAVRGRVLPDTDRRVLSAFAHQAAAAADRQRLQAEATRARELAEIDKVRTALLAAVSHDLRTPLASVKASVSSLRQDDVDWDPEDRAELLATIEESADRLNRLIANLLDMTRLQTGAVAPLTRPAAVDEIVPFALAGVPEARVEVDVPETLPQVLVDPGLLEQAIANVVENAVRYSAGRILVAASELRFGVERDHIEIHVVDHGPGVPDHDKDRIFGSFQRLGDAPQGTGVGLGLAVARGFTEAMGGTLTARDTPGGGLTMVFALPIAQDGPNVEDR